MYKRQDGNQLKQGQGIYTQEVYVNDTGIFYTHNLALRAKKYLSEMKRTQVFKKTPAIGASLTTYSDELYSWQNNDARSKFMADLLQKKVNAKKSAGGGSRTLTACLLYTSRWV